MPERSGTPSATETRCPFRSLKSGERDSSVRPIPKLLIRPFLEFIVRFRVSPRKIRLSRQISAFLQPARTSARNHRPRRPLRKCVALEHGASHECAARSNRPRAPRGTPRKLHYDRNWIRIRMVPVGRSCDVSSAWSVWRAVASRRSSSSSSLRSSAFPKWRTPHR